MNNIEKLNIFEEILLKAWSRKTCYPPQARSWSKENPYLGQCAITALILQDYFGGEILYNKENNHYWNKLPYGEIVDLTIEQFGNDLKFMNFILISRKELINRKDFDKAKTYSRYIHLKKKIENLLHPKLFLVEEVEQTASSC